MYTHINLNINTNGSISNHITGFSSLYQLPRSIQVNCNAYFNYSIKGDINLHEGKLRVSFISLGSNLFIYSLFIPPEIIFQELKNK